MDSTVSVTCPFLTLALAAGIAGAPIQCEAQGSPVPPFLRDRGTGIAASIFGTYIRPGELLIYPFAEYTRDHDREYQPAEFGLGPDVDFRGRFRSVAGQIFLGYGVTDWLALEFEAAVITARLEKSPSDSFATPARIEESGIADFEGQVRARVVRETERRPEVFGYVEVTPPSQTDKRLIAEPDLDFKPGVGAIKGFAWGTVAARVTVEYNHEESKLDFGEVSLEYLKRVSPALRLFLAFEGGETGALDEWELIPGVRWRLSDQMVLKFDSPLGISSKATDWAPQIGVMFSFPP